MDATWKAGPTVPSAGPFFATELFLFFPPPPPPPPPPLIFYNFVCFGIRAELGRLGKISAVVPEFRVISQAHPLDEAHHP